MAIFERDIVHLERIREEEHVTGILGKGKI